MNHPLPSFLETTRVDGVKAPQGRRDQCRIRFMRTMIATMGRTTQSLIEGSSSRGVCGAVAAIVGGARVGAVRRGLQRRGSEAADLSLGVLRRRSFGGGAQRARLSDQTALQAYTCDSLYTGASGRFAAALACACDC